MAPSSVSSAAPRSLPVRNLYQKGREIKTDTKVTKVTKVTITNQDLDIPAVSPRMKPMNPRTEAPFFCRKFSVLSACTPHCCLGPFHGKRFHAKRGFHQMFLLIPGPWVSSPMVLKSHLVEDRF